MNNYTNEDKALLSRNLDSITKKMNNNIFSQLDSLMSFFSTNSLGIPVCENHVSELDHVSSLIKETNSELNNIVNKVHSIVSTGLDR